MAKTTDSYTELLRGNTPTLILSVLARGTAHGYAIARAIEAQSEDALSLGEGSLYPALRALEREDYVISLWEPQESGPARKVYELTDSGRQELARRTRVWRSFVASVEQILGETPHANRPRIIS
jgi:PadR family transcriptional regulator, regulatory protein PadR